MATAIALIEVDHGDLCVLSGIANEIAYADATKIFADIGEIDHISLGNCSAEFEPLSHYHPDGVHPRAVCNRLAAAGLLDKSHGRHGIEWRLTPEGEAVLDELADELPALRCKGHYLTDGGGYEYCGNAAIVAELPERPNRFFYRHLAGRCENCIRDSVQIDIEYRRAEMAKEIERLHEVVAYRDSVLAVLDARTDHERAS